MNLKLTLLLFPFFTLIVKAQQSPPPAPATQQYGKVDISDLQMTSCDFEKDANAEVLFNNGKIYYGADLKTIITEVHRRVKIFNDYGKHQADLRLKYEGGNRKEYINGIEAETINLNDGKTEVTKIDKKSILNNVIDNEENEVVFSLPNVKQGSIIEYKYKLNSKYNASVPYWYFQEDIPVRYAELSTSIPEIFYFRSQPHITMPLVKHSTSTDAKVLQVATHTFRTGSTPYGGSQETDTYPYNVENEVMAFANIPSLQNDPYMSSFANNVQYFGLQLVSVKPIGGFNTDLTDTWAKVGGQLADDDDFGGQLRRKINNEEKIIAKANTLPTDDAKIAYIFTTVKNAMKWNGIDRWYTIDGTYRAWEKKVGNSAEINLIVYHLLKKCGIDAYPMVVSTREHGRVNPYYTSLIQFNRTVVYIPVDSVKHYVLDATGKYNTYTEAPAELLNSTGLYIDKSKNTFSTIYLENKTPAREVILVNAEIKPGAKLQGTVQINSMGYHKAEAVKKYKTDGEIKYIDYLRNNDNALKISSLKLENMEVDTLPLTQNVAFDQELTGSDDNYIYLNPNIFTSIKKNPFISENRLTDLCFGYCKSYSINNIYKLPAGYKIDALPKTMNLVMPDKSISFKRMVAEQDGSILVHFVIDYKRSLFTAEEYPEIHNFYKKMFEMLNEQIVLKKS